MRKRQKKRQLWKKWNERKGQRNTKNSESSEEDDREDGHSKAKVPRVESPRRIPIRKKKAKKATSTSKQEKINKNLLEETTPLHKPKVKLKQTKLNFQTREVTNSNTNEISLFKSKFHNRSNSKRSEIAAKLITSTPLRHGVNIRKSMSSPDLEKNNITFIKTTKNTANKLDDSKNSDQLRNKKTPEKKTQEKTGRLLRNNTKATGLLSQVLKTRQRLTRSMTER